MSFIPVALTIAGSDSGGGAGIQADLRTFSFHQVHGTSALTCITAQNTLGVNRVDLLPAEAVLAQIQAVIDDIGVHALKTGMLPNRSIIATVAAYLKALQQFSPSLAMVIDPVMVSRAGAKLIDEDAIATLKADLIPLATVLTPNRYEAEILSGQTIQSLEDMKQVAKTIASLGPRIVVVKGGGMTGEMRGVDVVCTSDPGGTPTLDILRTARVETQDTHGTGCTLSAAIAANLAQGKTPQEAIHQAKNYVTQALQHSLRIGEGQGPVGHFFPLYPDLPLSHIL